MGFIYSNNFIRDWLGGVVITLDELISELIKAKQQGIGGLVPVLVMDGDGLCHYVDGVSVDDGYPVIFPEGHSAFGAM